MSFRTYNALWADAQDDLGVVLEKDQELHGTFHQDQRADVIHRLKRVYVQYLGVARKLDTCYDLLLHPQKRLLLRRLLDSIISRIVEMKHELVALDLSDIQHCDDIMAELGLTPEDMEVPIPTYIRRERAELINEIVDLDSFISSSLEFVAVNRYHIRANGSLDFQLQRNIFIDDCLRRAGLEAVSEDEFSPLTVSEAILLLQKHERAKQGRAKADHRRDMLAKQERERGRGRQQMSMEAAVVKLQAVTRGMLARRIVREMRYHEELFLGLRPDPSLDRSWGSKLEKVKQARYRAQEERKKELEETEKRIQTKIIYEEGSHLLTTMEDKIREWMFSKKHETGKFPDLPDEEEGGSSSIVGMARPDDDMASEDARSVEKKEAEERDCTILKFCVVTRFLGHIQGKSEREKAREQAKQKKKKEEEDRSISLKPSSFVSDIQSSCEKYQDVWVVRDIERNPKEHPEKDMIETEQRAKVEVEIRRQVDYLMRQELQRLKEDVEGEKRGAKKKKRVKKGGKKGRKRKEKDLTPDRTTESLFEELVLNGIIKKVPEVRLKDIYGNINLVGSEVVTKTKYPLPALGDIKNILAEYVVLPLGVQAVHEQVQLVRSVLVCGPRGCGKTSLVHALAYEAGATLMDLTATNIVGRYPGRAGLNMLTHLVMKVGRLLQPTLVLIDNADKMFLKKGNADLLQDSPSPAAKMTHLNGLKTDRVYEPPMPWNCDVKLSPRLDIGGLARITDGFTTGHICSVVSQVVTEQRLAKQDKSPLTAVEFVVPLSKIEPIYKEEEEAMRAWFQKTPIMKKRGKSLEEELEAMGLKGKGGKKNEPKKKSKGKKGKKKKK
ncbi:IQ and AAA domain-containing protein 1-like [Penaeus monodon]|uniref:IQ and AAA domain-containing protein 1-like n=1 Tax=Penaeus monodon TaxID=6687 RepID=UPI0018A73A7C|nr:IQ and AAA domain-containing protein 1-like [Penaeus monodon]